MSRMSVVWFGVGLLFGAVWRPDQALAQPVDGSGPRLVHLMFADGQTAIPGGETCQGARVPPAYHCPLAGPDGSPEPCRQEILGYLDRWFGAFEIAFTSSPPATPHDTVVITSQGDWCMAPRGLLGDSPLVCEPAAGVSYVYECGASSERCAALIAHEEGHLLGLEHVVSSSDLMAEGGCWDCAGFEDRDNRVVQPSACGRTVQNAHRLLGQRLGQRPPDDVGGCDVSGGRPGPAPVAVLGLSLLAVLCVRDRSRPFANRRRANRATR